jgi:hypothetical protein
MAKPNEPPAISKDLDVKPAILKADQTRGVIELKTSGKTERGMHTIVVRADATIGGIPYTAYSELVPMTVKEPPQTPAAKPKAKPAEKK